MSVELDVGPVEAGDDAEPLLPTSGNSGSPLATLAGGEERKFSWLFNPFQQEIHEHDGVVVRNKLNTINGVFVPCSLNIMGVILFERLGWGVGQLGVGGTLLAFGIGGMQVMVTVLSLSAIATNGNMMGGGSYYMISRTLGPEFGGSVGVLFYAAYSVGAAFYATGFAEEVVDTWIGDTDNHPWAVIGFASMILFINFCISMMGARYFTKVNVPLFSIQCLGIITAMLSMYFRGTVAVEASSGYYHYSWSWSRLVDNWSTVCESSWGCYSFQGAMGVMFPALTGIMEGANLSGDLKDPGYSIPRGTISAVSYALVVYTLLIFAFGGSFSAEVLINDTTVMQEVAWGSFGTYVVIAGVLISSCASSLGSLFGGSRVMQAIARDNLFPFTSFLGYGTQNGDEPRIALCLTWFIAQLLCLIGSVDTIASITTALFCLTYATVNLSCLLLELSGTPNFRPVFKFYHWITCLLGFILNLIIMFFVDYKFGTGALIAEVAVFVFIVWRAPQNVWGDVTAAVIFHQVRKYLLRLDERKQHSKLWRPSVLLFVDTNDLALIDFCNNMKKGGLYVMGTVLQGEFTQFGQQTQQIRHEWLEFIDRNRIKAFPQVSVAPSARLGYENMLLLSGLGALQPNMIVMPLIRAAAVGSLSESQLQRSVDDNDEKKEASVERRISVFDHLPEELQTLVVESPAQMPPMEYMLLLRNILSVQKNIVLTDNFDKFDYNLLVSQPIASRAKKTISEEESNTAAAAAAADNNDIDINRRDSIGGGGGGVSDVDSSHSGFQTEAQQTPTSRWTFTRALRKPQQRGKQFVDVWLFARDYSYNLTDRTQKDRCFAMLLMQLAHILLLNKVWDRAAKLRVFLIVPTDWSEDDQHRFDDIEKGLRLKTHQLVTVADTNLDYVSWSDVNEQRRQRQEMRGFYRALNSMIAEHSTQSYFTFVKMPQLPPQLDDSEHNLRNANLYFECLRILTNHLPPIAIVCTGETIPVISVEI